MKFCFGDIVVVEGNLIGVVVRSWIEKTFVSHDVYVREWDKIIEFTEDEIERYMVRHKYLDEVEIEWQKNAIESR